MIKKAILGLLGLTVIGLALSYRHGVKREQNENLIANAYYADLIGVKEEIENGADPTFTLYFTDKEREYNGVEFNALHAAASGGNEDIINYLLNLGMDINTQTPQGWTPLFIATRDGRTEAAKLLVFRQADLNIQTDLGATALLMAVTQPCPTEKQRLDLVTYLLKRGADPNLATTGGISPLYYAAVSQKLPMVEVLVENGAQATPELYEKAAALIGKEKTATARKILRLLKKSSKNQ